METTPATPHPKDEWKLRSFTAELMTYGENKGKYVGKIVFANGQNDQLCFAIPPEKSAIYIQLMSVEITNTATELGKRIAESLKQ